MSTKKVSILKAFKTIIWPRRKLVFIGLGLIVISKAASFVTPIATKYVIDDAFVNKDGEELDMGTEYDFFGRRAHIDFYDLPDDVLKNRKLLAKMMEIQGLKGIQSEWWHYSLKTEQAPLDDWVWPCD